MVAHFTQDDGEGEKRKSSVYIGFGPILYVHTESIVDNAQNVAGLLFFWLAKHKKTLKSLLLLLLSLFPPK